MRNPRGVNLTDEAYELLEENLTTLWQNSDSYPHGRRSKLTREIKAQLLGLDAKTIDRFDRRQPLSRAVIKSIFESLKLNFSQEKHSCAGLSNSGNLTTVPTRCIGRDVQVGEIRAHLKSSQLVTLTGPGGVGKTRLTFEVAEGLRGRFPAGIWFVKLAAESSSDSVADRVAATLGVPEEDSSGSLQRLIDFIQGKQMLLILDNCEHVLKSCAMLANALITSSPALRVLATSRERLHIRVERPYRVPPLDTPDPKRLVANVDDIGALVAGYDSVTLFVECARIHRSGFALTDQNSRTLASICHRLGGIPLALELAASRIRAMTLEEVELGIRSSSRLLEGGNTDAFPHQLSVQATIEWSYDLLEDAQKMLLLRLSVFVDGCSQEAAKHVCSGNGIDESDVANLLTSLADKSLLEYEEIDGKARYRLLETVRQYAQVRLRDAPHTDIMALRASHLEYFLHCVEGIAKLGDGADLNDLLRRLTIELDNLRAALDYCLITTQTEKAIRLATGLSRLFYTKGLLTEGEAWTRRLISLADNAPPELRRKAYHGIATIALVRNDYTRAQKYWEQCLTLNVESDEENWALQYQGNLGNVALALGDHPRAKFLFNLCLKGFRERDNARGVARTLANLALVSRGEENYSSAITQYNESIDIFRELDDKYNLTLGLNNLASILISAGEYRKAHTVLAEAIELCREQENEVNLAHSLSNYVSLAVTQRDLERAAILIGAEEALRNRIGMPLPMDAQPEYQKSRIRIMGQLGHDIFAAMVRVGECSSLHQLCQYARTAKDMTVD